MLDVKQPLVEVLGKTVHATVVVHMIDTDTSTSDQDGDWLSNEGDKTKELLRNPQVYGLPS